MKDHEPPAIGRHSRSAALCEAFELAQISRAREARNRTTLPPAARVRRSMIPPAAALWRLLCRAEEWLDTRPATRSAIAATGAVLFIEIVLHVFR